MTPKGKKFRITTEKHEIFIVRLSRDTEIYGFCPNCKTEVEMLTLDSTVRVSGVSGREVIRQIAAEVIHSIETASGGLLVCRNCLKHCLQKENS